MKVYVIIKIYGVYDQCLQIDTAWSDPLKADERKLKLMADNEALKYSLPPYREEDFLRGDLTDEQDEEYYAWIKSVNEAEEFLEPRVIEVELDPAS